MKSPLLLFTMLLLRVPAPAESVYQVTFKVVTAFGEPVEARIAALGDAIHHRDLTANCSGLQCKDLPEGPYGYIVTLPANDRKVEGTTVIYRKNQIVLVEVGAVAADIDDASFTAVKGRIVNASAPADQFWVRLQALFSDVSVSAAVSRDGAFELDSVRPGKWMLLVFQNTQVVHHEPYTCESPSSKAITIDLGGSRR